MKGSAEVDSSEPSSVSRSSVVCGAAAGAAQATAEALISVAAEEPTWLRWGVRVRVKG